MSRSYALTEAQRERKRERDRKRTEELRSGLRVITRSGRPPSGAAAMKGRPCGACASSGCEGFRGDLSDTYDRADCRACDGRGHIPAGSP